MRFSIFLFFLFISRLVVADTIPSMYIETENHAEIASKEEYLGAKLKIDDGGSISDNISCEIKGRGNYTWKAYPKKPYKIKFKEKIGLFGFPNNKKWVLLGDFCDCSLLRTAYMSELSRAIGLEWTFNYQHVNLYINGNYAGIYILIDHLEKSKNRINVENDGYILENDIYYYEEPLYFTSKTYSYNYTFKYPETSGDKAIKEGDESWNYIVDLINKVELAIKTNDSNLPELIDYESFAKWFILMELSLNVEPNIYYVIERGGGKIKMYPAWDAEWSLGLAYKTTWDGFDWMSFNTTVPYDVEFWPNNRYFKDLIRDIRFREKIVEQWDKVKSAISMVDDNITQVRNNLEGSIDANFEKWKILGIELSVCSYAFPTWEKYCNETKSYLAKRIEWFNDHVHSKAFYDPLETSLHLNSAIDNKLSGAIYGINGSQIKNNNRKQIYIKDGKKFLMR